MDAPAMLIGQDLRLRNEGSKGVTIRDERNPVSQIRTPAVSDRYARQIMVLSCDFALIDAVAAGNVK